MPGIIPREELEKEGILPKRVGDFEAGDNFDIPQEPKEPKSIGGFLSNVLSSGAKQISGFAETILHPIETAKAIGKTALGTAELLVPGEQEHEKYPRAVFEFYKERYKNPERILETLYQDPVGALLDLSVLASGIGGAGRLLTRAGEAGNLSKLATAGKTISRVGETIRPTSILKEATKQIRELTGKTKIKSLETLKEYPQVVKESVAQVGSSLTGAPVETFEKLLPGTTPEIRAKVFKGIMENPDELLTKIHTEYKNAINQYKRTVGQEYERTLNQLGKQYQLGKMRNQIKSEVLDALTETLGDAGVKVKRDPVTGRITGLNFKNSMFAGLKSEQKIVNNIVNLLQNEWTAYGSLPKLENLERNLKYLLQTSTGKFLRTTGKQPNFTDIFNIQFLDKFRNVLTKYVPEYETLLKHPYREFKVDIEPKLLGFLGIKSTGKFGEEMAKQNLLRIFNNAPTLNAYAKSLSDLEDKLIKSGILKEGYTPELAGLLLNPKVISGKEQGIGILTRGVRGVLASNLSWLLRLSQSPEVKFLYNVFKNAGIPAERLIMSIFEGMIPETEGVRPEDFELPSSVYGQ
ncbi:MAG: hypothetical protein ABIL76_04140 [candidate division WOR-3 bacterium]